MKLLLFTAIILHSCLICLTNDLNHRNQIFQKHSLVQSCKDTRNNDLQVIAGIQLDEYDFDTDLPRRDVALGKDRELFYASIDLKWLFRLLCDRFFWKAQFFSLFKLLKGLDSSEISVKNAIEVLTEVRRMQKQSNIRCFRGSLSQAESFARYESKPILLYIEDGDFLEPSTASVFFRLALSDNILGSYVNDNFIFFIGRTSQKEIKKLMDSVGIKHFPVLSIALPSFAVDKDNLTFKKLRGSKFSLQFCKSYGSVEIKATKILKFLQKNLDPYTQKLNQEKSQYESRTKFS